MSLRFRLLFVLGCMLVLALHAPRCLDALRGVEIGVEEPANVAVLEVERVR
jgi:hypothetical protein